MASVLEIPLGNSTVGRQELGPKGILQAWPGLLRELAVFQGFPHFPVTDGHCNPGSAISDERTGNTFGVPWGRTRWQYTLHPKNTSGSHIVLPKKGSQQGDGI